ncbi:hypothetical protein FB107DRAFT_274575 [Schizophyllum commune]
MADSRLSPTETGETGDATVKHASDMPQQAPSNKPSSFCFPFPRPIEPISTPRQQRPSSHPCAITNAFATRDDPLGTNKLMTHENLDPQIEDMLKNSTVRQAGEVISGLFSGTSISQTATTLLQAMIEAGMYDNKAKRWPGAPNFDKQDEEEAVAEFLQSIVDFILNHCNVEGNRKWTAEFHGADNAQAGVTNRHPDLSFLDGPGCKGVIMNAELKSSEAQMFMAVKQLHNSALNCMPEQDDRLYFTGLAIASSKFRVVVHHRAGCVVSTSADIHANALMLVKLLAGYTLLGKDQIGFDPHVQERLGKRYVSVKDVEYEIVRVISTDATICGRGTVCWVGRREGDDTEYVIKNLWHDTSRAHTEYDFYEAAYKAGVQGIAHVVAHEVVEWAQGTVISTRHLMERLCGRKKAIPSGMENREYRRIVLKGVGSPLSEFSSKLELISAMINYVITLRELSKNGIIHADICDANLVLGDGAAHEIRPGVLIDFDYAFFSGKDRTKSATGVKTAHASFAACDLLCHPDVFPHEFWHDLESLLYVFIWCCSVYTGPKIEGRKFKVLKTPLREWLEGTTSMIGAQKAKTMRLQQEPYDRIILDKFLSAVIDPYFADLKECIHEWRAIVMRRGPNPPTYEEVLDVLQRYLEKVREQGVPTLSGSDAEGASPATALTTSAVPTPVEAVPVPEASRAVVSAPAASRRLPSRKRKNEARNVSPDAVPADDLRACETCCLEFPVSETIRCIAKSDCCSPPGWFCKTCALPEGIQDTTGDWLCHDCRAAEEASSSRPKAKRHRK